MIVHSLEMKKYAALRHMKRESSEKPKGISVYRCFMIAMIYIENEKEARNLLTSKSCRFTTAEINQSIYDVKYHKKYYIQNRKTTNDMQIKNVIHNDKINDLVNDQKGGNRNENRSNL